MEDEGPEETMEKVLQKADEVQEQLGANVRMYRAYHRLTQGEVAERADLDRNTVAKIERGEANPRLRTLGRLAFGFNMPAHALLNRFELPDLEEADDE